MKLRKKNLDKPKVFDSKDLSEDTQRIRLDKLQEKLKEEEDYSEEFKAYEEYKIMAKRKRKAILVAMTVVVLILIGSVSIFTVKRFSKIAVLEHEAQEAIKREDYDRAAEIYKDLYEETEEKEYMQNYKIVSRNLENEEIYKEAEKCLKDKEYKCAVELLLSISTSDDNFQNKINKNVNMASDAWYKEISKYYNSGDLDKSLTEINSFLNLLPDNIKAIDLKNKLLKNDQLREKDESSVSYKNNKEKEKLSTQLSKKMYEKSKRIVGTEQYITVEDARVRTRPSRDAEISGKLKKGDKVYIEDTYVEGANSIWCKINYHSRGVYKTGWVSHSIISGT